MPEICVPEGDINAPLDRVAVRWIDFAVRRHGVRAAAARDVILFIPDGLRSLKVTPETAPTMAMVREKGVNFKNSHSLFPTFTTANASGLATGHYLGDTGDFSNTIYSGYPTHVPDAPATVTPFLENDAVLGDVDEHFRATTSTRRRCSRSPARGASAPPRSARSARS